MKAKYNQIIDSLERVGDGIVIFDKDLNYVYVNESGGKLLSRSPNDLIGKNYKKEYPEALETPFGKAYLRALETQQPQYLEENYLLWDKWFSNRIFPSEYGVTIIFQEITESKKNELFLKNSENFIKNILDSLPVGILVVNRNTKKFIFANETICTMLGYSRTEFYTLSPVDIHPDRLSSRVESLFHIHYDTIDETKDIDMLRKDGTTFPADISAVEIVMDGIQCLCGVFNDITQIKISKSKISEQLVELQRWHEATLGRENRIMELKKEVNQLLSESGLLPRYTSVNQ